MREIKLPELGENIETVEVSAVMVAVGENVSRDQPLIEVETEKASLEVPSECAGRVAELLVEAGSSIRVGQVIVRIDEASDSTETSSAAPAAKSEATAPVASPAPTPKPVPAPAVAPAVPGRLVPAAPSARALARQIGVDITTVGGSGPGGRISRDDVKAHAKRLIQGMASAGPPVPELPDFSRWGEIEREPLKKIRQATARAMLQSWTVVPHVTQNDRADITQIEAARKAINAGGEAAAKLTMTAIVIDVVANALREFPQFNASLDIAANAVVYKKYFHIGVAVDTDRGLLVPVIRDVDQKTTVELAGELNDLARRARDKKLGLDEMRGACFTVSNLGGLGTTYFSPIVNWPEVAILGVGRAQMQPLFVSGAFEPRLIMPLSLSYDHRIIDGADAARFLRWTAEALESRTRAELES